MGSAPLNSAPVKDPKNEPAFGKKVAMSAPVPKGTIIMPPGIFSRFLLSCMVAVNCSRGITGLYSKLGRSPSSPAEPPQDRPAGRLRGRCRHDGLLHGAAHGGLMCGR